MNLKKMVASAATILAALVVASTPAQAGQLQFDQNGVAVVSETLPPGAFAAVYNFDVPLGTAWDVTATFSGFDAGLVPFGATLTGVDLEGGSLSVPLVLVGSNRFDLGLTTLSSGAYDFALRFAVKPFGGLVAGVVNVVQSQPVSPVPEPSGLALILAGGGVVWMRARRLAVANSNARH